MSRGVARFSISTPPELLEEFDRVVKGLDYDRSKAIQAAMRHFITEYRWMHEAKGLGVGALVMVYDHSVKGVEERMTDIQHSYSDLVTSTLHVHLDERLCLQIIAVKGTVEAIRGLAREVTGKRGVKQVKLALVTP